jgi:hypothetical protein
MSMTWLLCDYGEVLALAPSAADRDALESAAGTGGPGFWAGYWQHRPAYDRADIGTARYWTQVLGRGPGRARLRRIAELDAAMWSRPNQGSLDAAASAAERGVKLALLSNAPARLARHFDRLPWLSPFTVHQLQSALMNLPLVTSADGVLAGRQPQDSLPRPEGGRPQHRPKPRPVSTTSKRAPRSASSAGLAAHGTVPEDADH